MPTTIHNEIAIAATPEQVWAVLADLGALATYDPGLAASSVVGDKADGLGARRRCEVSSRVWFIEEVTTWAPHDQLRFTIVECNLPTTGLSHTYTLTPTANGTTVTQVMQYDMKFGALGRAMDKAIVRRKSDEGIKAFFVGLKQHVEAGVAEAA